MTHIYEANSSARSFAAITASINADLTPKKAYMSKLF